MNSVTFSPDGRLLASGADMAVRLWQVEDEEFLLTLEVVVDARARHKEYSVVNSVAFSPDGRLLASGASDKTVRLWWIA